MIFAFGEDGMITVHESEADAQRQWEGLDVESHAVVFYDERGSWLKPHFTRPNEQSTFGIMVTSGEYRLIASAEVPPEVDMIEVALAEAAGVEPNPHLNSVSAIRDHIRCAESKRLDRIEQAFRAGDLAALRAALDDPAIVPNGPMPTALGPCLTYAIYWSPLPFIRQLLELGADPNQHDGDGFPPLIAALTKTREVPGSRKRDDVAEIVALLLKHGADPNQRGVNDYTALHQAVAERNAAAIELRLAAGADPKLKTRIDECETPAAMARSAGLAAIADRLDHA